MESPVSSLSQIPPEARRHRTWKVFGLVVAVVLIALGLIMFVAPTHLARYVLASQLDNLGIDYQGVETLDVDLWKREAWMGPVRFRMADSDPGQLGRLGVRIDLMALFHRRASIEQLIVSGIDILVERAEDNAISVNGIPLAELAAGEQPPPEPVEEGEPWDAGLDTFELRDSRLLFEDRGRGTLEVDVERLLLAGFRTWEPEQPGTFDLLARVNDVEFEWVGETRPFADSITLSVDSRIDQVALPKVVRFTGPLAMERNAGVFNTRFEHELTLFASGRLTGLSEGSIEVTGADYARAEVADVALARADVELDVQYDLSAEGDLQIGGRVRLNAEDADLAFSDGTEVDFGSADITLTDLEVASGVDGSLRLSAKPQVDMQALRYSGSLELSVDTLINVLLALQNLPSGEAVTAEATGLSYFIGGEVALPQSEITVERLLGQVSSLGLETAGGKLSLDLVATSELSGLRVGTGDQGGSVGAWRGVLKELKLRSGGGTLSLQVAGAHELTGGRISGTLGEARFGSLEAVVESLGMQSQTRSVAVQTAGSSKLSGIALSAPEREGHEATSINVGSLQVAVHESALEAGPSGQTWHTSAEARAGSLAFEVAEGKMATGTLEGIALTDVAADQSLRINAESLRVIRPEIMLTRTFLATFEGGAGSGEAPAQPVPAAPAGDDGVGVEQPGAEPARAASSTTKVSRVQHLLTDQGFDPGPVDGIFGPRTAAAIRAFQQRSGLPVDGKVSARLLADLEAAARGQDSVSAAAEAGPQSRAASKVAPKVKLALFELVDGAVIHYRDDTVVPQVDLNTVVKTLEARNLDSGNPSQHTDLRLVGDVNEFTHVELAGWVAPFGDQPDLDLEAKVEHLELPPYSPYAAELAGVNLESGQLTANATAEAKAGALDAELKLDLDDLEFSPLSEADAKRLSAQAGIPIDTAVALLEDANGHIQLTVPVGGTVAEPKADLSEAIGKAVGGVLKAVFPPTAIASLLSK